MGIKSVFKGRVNKITYVIKSCYDVISGCHWSRPYVVFEPNFDRYEQFYECELDLPPLEKGEQLYISELDIKVLIEAKIRSTDGGYTYHTDYIVKNEENEDDRVKAEKLLEKEVTKYEKYLVDEGDSKKGPRGIIRRIREWVDEVLANFR